MAIPLDISPLKTTYQQLHLESSTQRMHDSSQFQMFLWLEAMQTQMSPQGNKLPQQLM
jgi:hypothetical protein